MDNRKKDRIVYKTYSIIKFNGNSIQSDIDNISLEGMLVKSAENIKVGTNCEITIILEGKSTRLSLNMTGKIIRSENNKTAINFTDISTDTFVHLRNIISNVLIDEKKITKAFEDADLDKTITD